VGFYFGKIFPKIRFVKKKMPDFSRSLEKNPASSVEETGLMLCGWGKQLLQGYSSGESVLKSYASIQHL
jgi:hypothetical protein